MKSHLFLTCKWQVTTRLSDELCDLLHEERNIEAMEHGMTDKKAEGYIAIVCKGAVSDDFRGKLIRDPDILDFTIYGTASQHA